MAKKYFHEGEDFNGFIDRVVSIFSPSLQPKMREALLNGDFFPAGRSLYGAGSKGKFKASMSNCFTAGNKVITKRGLLNIEDVKVNDYVLTHDGTFQRVNAVMERDYDGDLYEIETQSGYQKTVCTPNHRFFTDEGWIRADRLYFIDKDSRHVRKGHHIAIPDIVFEKKYSDIVLSDIPFDDTYRIEISNGMLQYKRRMKSVNGKYYFSRQGHPVFNRISIDEDFRYFIGRWLGDGSITCRKGQKFFSILQIVFNATTEEEAFRRCKEIGERKFGLTASWRKTKQNTIALRFENPIIATWFNNEFGHGCSDKHVPDKYLGDLQIALGLLDSDGQIYTHGAVSITLKNLQMLTWLRDTLFLNGINCGKIYPTNYPDTYAFRIFGGISKSKLVPRMSKTYWDERHNCAAKQDSSNFDTIVNINVIENVQTKVYNLSVENNHSYTINGLVCHNCYILPSPADNIEDIYNVNAKMARIFSYGGGCGVNISNLRPKDAKVNNAARTSSGAVSFLELFNSTGNVIGIHGRRAAEMVGLNCEHPDIEEFLKIKQTNHKLEFMNISILFTKPFMDAVKKKETFKLHFTVKETGETIERDIDAAKFFHEFALTQWDWGDPGSIFIDRVRRYNLLSGYDNYKIEISNPCAEFFGNAYNSCNLGSINLYNCVTDKFTKDARIDWSKLTKMTDTAVRALDEILDYGYELQPLDENRKCIDDWRSIGLGIMGLADMFVAMGLRYGSEESIALAEAVLHSIQEEALRTSCALAKEKGAFKQFDWNKTKESPIIKMYPHLWDDIQKYGLRNGTLLSIAPTGTLSLLAGGFSGGVEPIYKIAMTRTTHSMEAERKTFTVFARSVWDLMEHDGVPDTVTEAELRKRYPFLIESHDIDPMDRVELQSAIQKYVDNAISSTVNLKESATPEDIEKIYLAAFDKGCKGITVFRDNCKRGSILDAAPTKKETDGIELDSIEVPKRHRVQKVDGATYVEASACIKNMYVTVNHSENNKIFEIFTNASGGCQANVNTITRLISLLLRAGVKVDAIIGELREAKCAGCQELRKQGKKVSLSCGNAIADALQKAYKELKDAQKTDMKPVKTAQKKGTEILKETDTQHHFSLICPECGQELKSEGRCFSCPNCGFSKCE